MRCTESGRFARCEAKSASVAGHPDAGSVRPGSYLPEHMFPTLTTGRQTPRSLRERVRAALDLALEFATLGEAHLDRAGKPVWTTAPTVADPHHRRLSRQHHVRRGGSVPALRQPCTGPVDRPASARAARPALPPAHRPDPRRA